MCTRVVPDRFSKSGMWNQEYGIYFQNMEHGIRNMEWLKNPEYSGIRNAEFKKNVY
jgi:hypothetical protein